LIDFHQLVQRPLETLVASVTSENARALAHLSELIGISHDVLLELIPNRMKSERFEDYEFLVALIR
jgi:hypothetical protein